MPKPRLPHNRGLPARWQLDHGAYYYRVPPGLESAWAGKKRYWLGRTLPEAYKTWAEKIGPTTGEINTVGEGLDRYALEVVPLKSPKKQVEDARAIVRLKKAFGTARLKPCDVEPQHIYQYVDKRRKEIKTKQPDGTVKIISVPAPVAAHREVEVLSHAFTKFVQWGKMTRHPFKGEVRLDGEPPRDRYVEDWEVIEPLALKPRRKKGSVLMIQAYIRLKLLTGMDRSNLLRIRPAQQFKEDGIHVQRHKTAKTTGKRTIYEWTSERRAAVAMALAARPVDLGPFLFCNDKGEGYINEAKGTCNGFDSMWGRFMDRVLKDTKVAQRFHERDLRAKVASNAESLEKARKLLAHVDLRTTNRIYRRKPEKA
jgi:integrase